MEKKTNCCKLLQMFSFLTVHFLKCIHHVLHLLDIWHLHLTVFLQRKTAFIIYPNKKTTKLFFKTCQDPKTEGGFFFSSYDENQFVFVL